MQLVTIQASTAQLTRAMPVHVRICVYVYMQKMCIYIYICVYTYTVALMHVPLSKRKSLDT